MLRVVPVMQEHELELSWLVPPQTPLFRTKPTRYLSHLLGHEGKGSLLSLLRDRGASVLSVSWSVCVPV
jgi:secreted Zn-dependent insulinase-like peptidase